jgi:hypothetical protein
MLVSFTLVVLSDPVYIREPFFDSLGQLDQVSKTSKYVFNFLPLS